MNQEEAKKRYDELEEKRLALLAAHSQELKQVMDKILDARGVVVSLGGYHNYELTLVHYPQGFDAGKDPVLGEGNIAIARKKEYIKSPIPPSYVESKYIAWLNLRNVEMLSPVDYKSFDYDRVLANFRGDGPIQDDGLCFISVPGEWLDVLKNECPGAEQIISARVAGSYEEKADKLAKMLNIQEVE